MFTSFDRAGHRLLSTEIVSELAALGQRLGITFTTTGGTIGTTDLTIKVVATSADTQQAEKNAQAEINVYGRPYGLVGTDYGLSFTSGGKRFKFTGVSPSRPKYPLDGECLSTGRSFKFGASTARSIIAARAVAPTAAQAAVKPEKLDPRYADAAQF